jgi:NAD(P)-dependent dehydrogenase (short-subunit alcohol dehydrogenase family)
MPTTYDFQNRTAVVTGGAQGIGRAIAQRLAESGATVWLWDRDVALAKTAAAELGAIAAPVDVTDLAQVEAAAKAAGGRIDILINNAGISGVNTPTWEYPPEEWARVLAINLTGIFNCCRTVAPMMIAQNYGRIVNIASIAGKEGNPNAVAYSASKAGVIGLTKSLGKELAGYDISVNCVTPAVAKTAIFDQMTEEHIAYMLSKIPRGRFVKVEEIADLVAFCASKECAFTTGAVFDISGGRATY